MEGRIKVSYDGQHGEYSFEEGAIHQFWIRADEKDTRVFGDRLAIQGRMTRLDAYANSLVVGDEGKKTRT